MRYDRMTRITPSGTHDALTASSAMMSPGRFVDPASLAEPVLSGPRFEFLWYVRIVRRLL